MSDQSPIAVITGGASGIGLAMAHSYARDGLRILIADIDEEGMQRARDELVGAGATVECAVVDLRDSASVADLGAAAKSLGKVTAVCMNAGVTATGSPLWETSEEVFDFLIDINLRGLFASIRTFVPILLEQAEPADVIITASMAGLVGTGFSGAYGASKSGAVALAKALRIELAGVAPYLRLAVLAPGVVQTNLFRRSAAELGRHWPMTDEMSENYHRSVHEMGVPTDVAVSWARRALAENRFWALPPGDDPFVQILHSERDELAGLLSGG